MPNFPQQLVGPEDCQENWEWLQQYLSKNYFRVYLSTNTSVNHGAVIPFDTVEEDDKHCYSTTTFKYIPTVSGMYHFTWAAIGPSAMNDRYYFAAVLVKNGDTSIARYGSIGQNDTASGGNAPNSVGSDIWRANGTTDYFQVIAYNASGAAQTVFGNAGYTWFSAHLI